ncbi:hypothetical protein TRVL_10333 [Trypanosoma vivax]|nr:hypothetical protein TRVL_10333 [Trypanosoma vivax]
MYTFVNTYGEKNESHIRECEKYDSANNETEITCGVLPHTAILSWQPFHGKMPYQRVRTHLCRGDKTPLRPSIPPISVYYGTATNARIFKVKESCLSVDTNALHNSLEILVGATFSKLIIQPLLLHSIKPVAY